MAFIVSLIPERQSEGLRSYDKLDLIWSGIRGKYFYLESRAEHIWSQAVMILGKAATGCEMGLELARWNSGERQGGTTGRGNLKVWVLKARPSSLDSGNCVLSCTECCFLETSFISSFCWYINNIALVWFNINKDLWLLSFYLLLLMFCQVDSSLNLILLILIFLFYWGDIG